ncbi:membrane-bound lytic murein transglycosylase MltC [Candidatus Curculioniphilus buchneri]|uniref:membrane-bound lytic murein transglycosylase MltC n=1 Tax=Candidatus Curculioniphilus buchneri TaxID=690594 RepID=UPI00376F302B
MKKTLFLLITVLLLVSCCLNNQKNISNQLQTKDTNSFNILVAQLAHNVEDLWGLGNVLIVGPKDYVKYTDRYTIRTHINFDEGMITIETISDKNLTIRLRQAIINTLLMNCNPATIDFYSDSNDIPISKNPFLYGQVLDDMGKPIRWIWRASRFADHLLRTKLQTYISDYKKIWSITIPLVPNHVDKRAHQYLDLVRKYARQYGIDQSLILTIIYTESRFNPYAISRANALGLMQIVQHSAGRDVFKMKGKWGHPSRTYLFNPENNIDTGTAYLAILQNKYLGGIINSISRRYAVITAYHGGIGSVLRVFSNDRNQAIQIINKMTPDDVYKALYTKHPSSESRRYLYKVNKLHKKYWR